MKKIALTLFAIFLFANSYGQSIDWSFLANSGLYRYTGNYTTSSTFLNGVIPGTKQGYPNNPYGNLPGFSYGAGFQAQYTAKKGFIAGLQATYDILRSRQNVDDVYRADLYQADYFANYSGIPATGQAFLVNQDINFDPYLGYRITAKKIRIDLMAGMDVALGISTYEYSHAKDDGGNYYQTSGYLGVPKTDIRLRFGTAIWYNRFALTGSYSLGIVNYSSDLLNDNSTPMYSKSELIRFGLGYKLNP